MMYCRLSTSPSNHVWFCAILQISNGSFSILYHPPLVHLRQLWHGT